MAHVEVPPPVGSSGQHVDALIINAATSELRQVYAIGSAVSSAVFAPVTSSAGLLVNVSSGTFTLSSAPTVSSTATTITSGTVTVSNPTTAVNVANSPTVLTASSGYLVRSLSSGTVTLSSAAALSSGTVTLSSNPTVVSASSGTAGVFMLVNSAAGAAVVTSSYGLLVQPAWSLSSSRLIVATTVGKISSAPGVLSMLTAYSTAVPAASAAYIRLYDQTTGNATSSNNSGLAGACALFRIQSTVGGDTADPFSLGQGVKFGTACSFDIVIAATSTAATLGGWVTAQYTS